jgi:hypothetical protein
MKTGVAELHDLDVTPIANLHSPISDSSRNERAGKLVSRPVS